MIRLDMYPPAFFGPIGEVDCVKCGRKLCLDTEAIQDEFNKQFYCEECHKEIMEEREEDEE